MDDHVNSGTSRYLDREGNEIPAPAQEKTPKKRPQAEKIEEELKNDR